MRLHTSFLIKFFLLFVMACTLSSPEVMAIDIKKIPPLSQPELMSEQELIQRTRLVEMVPENSPELAFEIRIPKSWETSEDIGLRNFMLSKKVVGELMRYYSPPVLDKRSSLSVSAMEMDYKISAKHWLVHYLLINGFSIEGLKELEKNKVMAEYVELVRDEPYHVRVYAINYGKTVMLAQYYSPLETHELEKQLQASVINSFRVLSSQESEDIPKDIYSFLDLAEFEYPLTWELRPNPIRNIDRMAARLMNVLGEGQLRGQISIHLISQAIPNLELEDEVQRITDEVLGAYNFQVGGRIDKIEDYKVDASIDKAVMEVYRLEYTERNIGYEYWFTVLSHTDYYYYIVSMITPSRERKFYLWAKNSEVYKELVESVKTSVDF